AAFPFFPVGGLSRPARAFVVVRDAFERMVGRRAAHYVARAVEASRFAEDARFVAIAYRPGEAHGARRDVASLRRSVGQAGVGERDRRVAALERPECHLARDLLAGEAEALDRLRRDAQAMT